MRIPNGFWMGSSRFWKHSERFRRDGGDSRSVHKYSTGALQNPRWILDRSESILEAFWMILERTEVMQVVNVCIPSAQP